VRTSGLLTVLTLAWALALSAGCAPAIPAVQTPVPPATSASVKQAQGPTPTMRTLLDERFQRAWPNDPRGNAWFGEGWYTLFARQPGQFVAVRAPIAEVPADVVVSATFHKVGGPPGGGYGLILRDQTVGAGDGVDQMGQYLVAAAGDRGEVGIWQRANSRWIDLLPWTRSAVVHPDTAHNDLKVAVSGSRLRFDVNGSRVAEVEVGFAAGGVGLFVGGDLYQVQLDRLLVEAAPAAVNTAAAASAPAAQPDIPATRTRLTALTQRAEQDPAIIQDPAWRQEMAATLAAVQTLASGASSPAPRTGASPDGNRVLTLLGGIADDLASIMDAFSTGVDSPRNPLNSPRALDQAAAHLESATRQANQVLTEVEAARNAGQAGVPAR
jgi:hypothetical protein